ncbi:MAG: acylneuraminate cytidylyltransferase family protein [Planctomycetota bacterium]
MKIVGLIPARAGSKRVPNKNLQLLNGRPLIHYTCAAAVDSQVLDAVYVNTDSPEIAAAAEECGVACPLLRPAHLARDDTSTLDSNRFMLDELSRRGENHDVVMILQPTSPLRQAADIQAAVELFETNAPCAVVSASPTVPASWLGHVRKDGSFDRLHGEDVVYRLNGAIYIYRVSDYLDSPHALRRLVYPMTATRGLDIDTLDDLRYAEFLLQQPAILDHTGV